MPTSPLAGSPITAEERKRVADWIAAQGKTPLTIGRIALAQAIGITERRARTILDDLRRGVIPPIPPPQREKKPDPPPKPERTEIHEKKGDDEWNITMPRTRISTLEGLIEHCKVDLSIWEVAEHRIVKSEVTMKPVATTEYVQTQDGRTIPAWVRFEKEPITEQMFHITARLVKRPVVIRVTERLIEEFQRKAELYSPQFPTIILRDLKQTGNMAEISIYDHHFGGLIWGKETGWEDYDTGIAVDTFKDAVTALLSRSKGYGIDKIMLSLGNDLQNADNRGGTTEAGTPQSNDSRYEKVCLSVQDTAVWAIEACLSVAPEVIVPMIRGNHDPLTTFHLGGYLQAWFRNCPNVKIDNSPLQRKAFQHGTVMLMLTHGKGVKTDEYPLLMATEYPQMWAATTWRETHHGHIHTRRKMIPDLDEIKGVAVRSMPSLRPPCSWGSDNGYVGNIRSAEALIWNDKLGLIGSAVHSVLNKRAA